MHQATPGGLHFVLIEIAPRKWKKRSGIYSFVVLVSSENFFDIIMKLIGREAAQLSWIAVLEHHRADRGLQANKFITRCFQSGEIHEFLLVESLYASRDEVVHDVYYLGFGKFETPCVLRIGDELALPGNCNATLFGFDDTHMPNHQNIIFAINKPSTGFSLGLLVGQRFCINPVSDN